jgi:hypothetical protein
VKDAISESEISCLSRYSPSGRLSTVEAVQVGLEECDLGNMSDIIRERPSRCQRVFQRRQNKRQMHIRMP